MSKKRSTLKRSGMKLVFYKLYKLSRRVKAFLARLNLRARFILAGAVSLVLVGIILIIALPYNGERNSFLPEAYAQEDDDMIIGFSESTPEPEEAEYVYDIEDEDEADPPEDDITLYQGCEDSERVTELQQRLMNLGYLDIDEPTLHFGPATKYAVQLFQRQHELEMDGRAGPITLELINSSEAKKYTLLEGTSGTDVDNFQRQLKDLGYLSKVTGYYGTETIDAVKAFQKENGLSADGKAGEKTFDMINSDKAKQSPTLAKQERRKANISKMIETARKQVGKKYVLGNVGPNSFDCSGLVYYCLKQAGSNRRRLNAAGYSTVSDWEKITSFGKFQKGDLLFFYNNGKTKVGHVGIYIGGGMMIDASSGNGKVMRRSCTTSYWKSHFVCARRPW